MARTAVGSPTTSTRLAMERLAFPAAHPHGATATAPPPYALAL
jgi:hypothetical protein